jgi:HEAT repeat protein
MLLTTLALVKRKVGKLPKRRTKLYSEAVAVLLNWNPRFYETIDEEEAIPQLEYLAYEMCRRGVQQLKEEEVLDLLDKLRHEYPNVRAIRRRESKAFLELLEARSSILIKSGIHWLSQGRKGKAVWEFRHLTFQEYLAARALLDGRYPGRDRTKMLAQQIAPLAGRMREAYGGYAHGATEMDVIDSWQEALRLVVADCKDDEVDDILHAIATPMAEEDAAKTARPRAVLAARCLAEEPNATEAKAEEILYGLVNQVIEDDGVGPVELTSMDSAVADLGNGPWAPILRKCLVQKFLSQAPDSLGNVGGLLAMLEMNCAPDDEREFELWFENLIQRLGVTDEIDLVTAALTARRAVYVGRALEVPTLAAKLLNLLSANAPVCHAAAWALVSLVRGSAVMRRQPRWVAKDEEIGSLIRGLERADINNSARVCLVNALGFSKDFRATPTLVRMLEDRVQDVRAAAAEALGDLGNVQVAALLIEKLGDSAEDVREAVAGALGMLGKEEAVAPLIEKLQDPALSVRVAAARALGMLGKEEAVTPLIGKLEDSADDMQGDAAEALGMLGKEEAVGPLIDKLEDPDGYVRYAAARALGMLGREDAVAPLIGKLEDPNYYVRETAARALGTLGKEEAVAPLIEKLEDPVGDVRKAAARALGMLGKEEAVGPLIGKLEDSADDMQGDAAEALGMLGKEEAVGPLIDKLEDPKSYVRYFAARALGRLSDGQAVTPLIGKLEDPSASVRSAAAEALGSLGDQQAVQHLRDRLSDTSWDVCVVSAIALERLGDVQGSSALTRFFGHIRPEMRLAAVGALSRTRDVLTQRLLSQDFSGWEQWLDPLEPITVARVARASVRLRITPEKVRSHYEALTEDFHLNLSWRNRH